MVQTFTMCAWIVLFYVMIQWLASVFLEDVSLVDRFWGGGFALVALVSFSYMDRMTPRALLLLALAVVWGLRRSLSLTWRNWGKGEDHRYDAMRTRYGSGFVVISLFTVFLFHGLLTWFISLPLQVGIAAKAGELNALDYIGVGVWVVGLLLESAGNVQLARFKANPANNGKAMNRGPLRYARHPYYFGDALLWWGIYLVAVSAPYGVFTILSPALMTYLVIRVSVLSLLEKKLRAPKVHMYPKKSDIL